MTISIGALVAHRYRITQATGDDTYEAIDERFDRLVTLEFGTGPLSDDVRMLDGGVHGGRPFRILAVFDEPVVDDRTIAMPAVETTVVPAVNAPVVPSRRSIAPAVIGVAAAAAILAAIVLVASQKNTPTTPPAATTTTTQATVAPTRATTRVTTRPTTTAPPVTAPPTTEETIVVLPPVNETAPPTTSAAP